MGRHYEPLGVNIETLDFFGLNVSKFSYDEIVQFVRKTLNEKTSKLVYGYSLGIIPRIQENSEILSSTYNADLFLADGRWFYLLCKLKKIPLDLEISIPKFVYLLLKIANELNKSVYLLGANEDNNLRAQTNISTKYKNLSVEGHHGYYDLSIENHIIDEIQKKKADIVLIGMNSPYKEILGKKLRDMNVGKIIVPCGGMIDVLSGKVKPMPKIIKKLGLGSLYRIIQEPRRLLKRYSKIYLKSLVIVPRILFNILINNKEYKLYKA